MYIFVYIELMLSIKNNGCHAVTDVTMNEFYLITKNAKMMGGVDSCAYVESILNETKAIRAK